MDRAGHLSWTHYTRSDLAPVSNVLTFAVSLLTQIGTCRVLRYVVIYFAVRPA